MAPILGESSAPLERIETLLVDYGGE